MKVKAQIWGTAWKKWLCSYLENGSDTAELCLYWAVLEYDKQTSEQ